VDLCLKDIRCEGDDLVEQVHLRKQRRNPVNSVVDYRFTYSQQYSSTPVVKLETFKETPALVRTSASHANLHFCFQVLGEHCLPSQLWFTKGKTSGFVAQLQGNPALLWNGADWTLQLFPSALGKVKTKESCYIISGQSVTANGQHHIFLLVLPSYHRRLQHMWT
jgi:hypothetical protein